MGKSGNTTIEPIDASKEAREFVEDMSDPVLQQRVLSSERTYRPQYTALDLSNQEQFLFGVDGNHEYQRLEAELAGLRAGEEYAHLNEDERRAALRQQAETLFPSVEVGHRPGRGAHAAVRAKNRAIRAQRDAFVEASMGAFYGSDRAERIAQLEAQMAQMDPNESQAGLLDILGRATPEISRIQSDAASYQRDRDIADVTRLLPEVMAAQREADPAQYALYDSLMADAQADVDLGGRLSPEEQRLAVQTAREGAQARGRGMDNAALFGEAMGRQQFSDARQDRARQFGQSMLGAGEMMNADPFMAILGRPSGATQMGQSQQLIGNDMMNNLGPALFDPNMGLNMAMAEQQNQTNLAAAQAGAQGSAMGGLFGGLGAAIGGIF